MKRYAFQVPPYFFFLLLVNVFIKFLFTRMCVCVCILTYVCIYINWSIVDL